jgi:hypothetical protein
MAVTPFRLGLTRDQLASFLSDHEQIKQFEKLFQTVDTINTVTLDDVSVSAGNAGASANEALSQVEALQSLVQLLAYAPQAPTQSDIDALQDQITALQQQPPPKEYRTPRFGSFYDTTTQTAAAINTAYAMTFNTTDLSFGVTRGSPTSRIYVDRPNVYNIQFSAQLDKTAGGVGLVWIWLRKNGVDVPDSAGQIRIQGNNAETMAAWNYLTQLNAGDYIEIMWEVDDITVQILYDPATAVHPAVPSVILTVSDNISAMEV